MSFSAGTGKSRVIEVIKGEFLVLYADDFTNGILRIAVSAPTGLAAKGVKGYTVHSIFAMDVAHGGEAEYTSLNPTKLQKLKKLFQKRPALLIIDEISMISNIMLVKIHLRLCEILGIRDLRKYFKV